MLITLPSWFRLNVGNTIGPNTALGLSHSSIFPMVKTNHWIPLLANFWSMRVHYLSHHIAFLSSLTGRTFAQVQINYVKWFSLSHWFYRIGVLGILQPRNCVMDTLPKATKELRSCRSWYLPGSVHMTLGIVAESHCEVSLFGRVSNHHRTLFYMCSDMFSLESID